MHNLAPIDEDDDLPTKGSTVAKSGDNMTGPLVIAATGAGGAGIIPNLRLERDTAPELHLYKRTQASGERKWKVYVSGPANEVAATPASLSFASLSDDELTNLATLRMYRDGRMLLGADAQGGKEAVTYQQLYQSGTVVVATGFTDYGGSFQCLVIRTGNNVTMQGLVKRTGADLTLTTGSTLIGTLPPGFRPVGNPLWNPHFSAGATTQIRMHVDTDGSIYVRTVASTIVWATNGYVSINGSFIGA